jgi:hypothetical protein
MWSSSGQVIRLAVRIPMLINVKLYKEMLVDSHCHLDFIDFASELDALVYRG